MTFPFLVKCFVHWTLPIAQAIIFNSGSVSIVNFVKFRSLISAGSFFIIYTDVKNFTALPTRLMFHWHGPSDSGPSLDGLRCWMTVDSLIAANQDIRFLFMNFGVRFIKRANNSRMNQRVTLLDFFPGMTFQESWLKIEFCDRNGVPHRYSN